MLKNNKIPWAKLLHYKKKKSDCFICIFTPLLSLWCFYIQFSIKCKLMVKNCFKKNLNILSVHHVLMQKEDSPRRSGAVKRFHSKAALSPGSRANSVQKTSCQGSFSLYHLDSIASCCALNLNTVETVTNNHRGDTWGVGGLIQLVLLAVLSKGLYIVHDNCYQFRSAVGPCSQLLTCLGHQMNISGPKEGIERKD